MTPTSHPLCNDVLKAPSEDPTCADLPIRREESSIWSFWTPTAEELSALVMGGSVALRVCGCFHPPLSLHATKPDGENGDRPRCEYSALLDVSKRIVSAWCRDTTDKDQRRRLIDEFLDLVTQPQPQPTNK